MIIALAILAAVLVGGLFVGPAQALPRPVPAERLSASLPAPGALTGGAGALGLDTSQRPTAAGYQAIAAGGYSFVGRYLYIPGGSKIYPVTVTELANARAAGVGLVLIFEWCDYTHKPTSYAQGERDGRLAAEAVAALGLPPYTTVYFSLDRAPTSDGRDYFRGVRSTYSGALGCYGSQAQLLRLQEAGLIEFLWYATWMDGNNIAPGWGEHFYQRIWIVKRGGVWCDQNWAFTQWIGAVR
jgi:hypothetical protein